MTYIFNRPNLVLLQRKLFKEPAILQSLNLYDAIVHQIQLPQIDERLQILDDCNLLVRQIKYFNLLLPVRLPRVIEVNILSILPLIITFLISILK